MSDKKREVPPIYILIYAMSAAVGTFFFLSRPSVYIVCCNSSMFSMNLQLLSTSLNGRSYSFIHHRPNRFQCACMHGVRVPSLSAKYS